MERPISWQTHPLTPDRFEDFADVINPTRRSNHCWCLSHRLRAKDIEELGKGDRQQAMRRLCERGAPAVEAYPVEPDGRMDTTMAFVGTRSLSRGRGSRRLARRTRSRLDCRR